MIWVNCDFDVYMLNPPKGTMETMRASSRVYARERIEGKLSKVQLQ